MGLSKRQQMIIDFLGTIDPEELTYQITEFGLFNFDSIASQVYDDHPLDLKKSQKVSLYRTLREMVDKGLIVTRKQIEEGYRPLPNWVTYWHLPDKKDWDLSFIKAWEQKMIDTAETRMTEFLSEITGMNKGIMK